MSGPSKIFTDGDDIPINFFFHNSIKKDGTKQKLKADIEEHGGRVVEDVFSADTILVDLHYGEANRRTLERSYVTDSNPTLHKIFVEYSPFIRKCIGRGEYRHPNPQRQGMNGIRPGSRRQMFTEDDDERLADYIAKSIPDEKAGGRLSLNFYKDLVRMGLLNPEVCGWATRHTAESWKERYKKRRQTFNRRIKEIVAQNPAPSQNQLWIYDRRLNGKRIQEHDSTEDEDEDQDGDTETWDEEAEETGQQEEEENDNRYDTERDEERRPLKSRRTAKNIKARQSGHSHGSQRPVQGKGKARAVQPQELVDEYDVENTNANSENHELFGHEPGPSNQNLIPMPPERNRQLDNVPLQDSHVSVPNVTTKFMHDEGPSRQNSPMFSGALPWPTPIPPKMSLHPSPMQQAGPQALSSPPRYRSQPPASKAKEIPPTTTTARSKRVIPKMAARRPRAFNSQNPSSQSKTRSEASIDAPETNSKRQNTNSAGTVNILSTEQVEADSVAVASRSRPSQDSIGKGRANKSSKAIIQVEHSHRQLVEPDPRSPSMDTDDAQIKGELFTNQSQSTFFKTVPIRASSPIELPSQFLESWETSRDRASKTNNIFLSQQSSSGHDVETQNRGPFTPTFGHSRERSTSSDDSFPFEGTNASAYKKVQTQKAKYTPYRPLEGTRASQYAS
ncbi:hypothetical protein JR316_0003351 [Psilocybe cubensis]|uniref:Uncharacterized protein n=2 Tax=Psilocybe cubensis TaxID=181762 RepID=A0ACB8H7A5_PSICU|nr:hypothetical protein JR316_0003351 [Psilocybe cubensis]KAH9483873.1 hypothetical protein JR316_0003351 [Psilocybe cubensis]